MKIGLVGLSRSGKTSLFNLLTGQSVATSTFGASRGELHMGVARVPDARVDRLSALFKPKKTTTATFEVVDLAGITKGERQGLDAKEFRNADALLHVVRAFPDATGAAPSPRLDIVDLETELILADLEVIERRLQRLEASIKKKRTDADVKEQAILLRLTPALEAETPIRAMDLPEDEAKAIRGFTFLSQKPILHCLSLAEKEIGRAASLVESFGLADLAEAFGAVLAMQDQHFQVGRELRGLVAPVGHQAGGGDHQAGAVGASRGFFQMQVGQGLHRLAQTHVVGDEGAPGLRREERALPLI